MKKIAIFTEGLTEQLFVAEVIKFLAAKQNYAIKNEKLYGGRRFPTITMAVDGDEGDPDNCDFYFLLLDCGTDSRVVSAIGERYNGLISSGYTDIIGVRDLAPSFKREQLERLVAGSRSELPNDPIDPLLVVAVMEAEAWFIAENTHFVRIDGRLTNQVIFEATGVDVSADASQIERPSQELPRIYQIAELAYDKAREQVGRTLAALDMEHYRDDGAFQRAASLKPLFERIQTIFIGQTTVEATAG
ncbi:hypothetical protein PH547_23545 [Rhizobium sp. CNPSo 3464]|uniref:hypothetical protein n=1 Tax=Rhizobium sp. CNPSo 3464 TaxID=3021406 RepID=UPI00254F8EBA|nr:hypothetical protein [Rhizobium sp. CNPSo 3464]MDK4741862.1 hypothetical protein [Rhizobium sp. CNPSo 3464]